MKHLAWWAYTPHDGLITLCLNHLSEQPIMIERVMASKTFSNNKYPLRIINIIAFLITMIIQQGGSCIWTIIITNDSSTKYILLGCELFAIIHKLLDKRFKIIVLASTLARLKLQVHLLNRTCEFRCIIILNKFIVSLHVCLGAVRASYYWNVLHTTTHGRSRDIFNITTLVHMVIHAHKK